MAIVQNIYKRLDSPVELGIRYYSVLSVLNNLYLTEREIQLLSYTAYKGSISTGGAKEGFIQQFGSSKASIGNMIHKLSKSGFLIKENNRTKVNSAIEFDFSNTFILKIILKNEK